MNICHRLSLLLVLLTVGITNARSQEVKIGYTNIELVLAYMPEANTVESTLATYQKKLGEQLQVKENYASTRLQEYIDKKEKNLLSPAEEEAGQRELAKLDEEIQKFATESENKLLAKREELLNPVLEKLQKAIDEIAVEKGYIYILNQTTSAGVSTILYGPDEDDLTEAILNKLGIQIPKE